MCLRMAVCSKMVSTYIMGSIVWEISYMICHYCKAAKIIFELILTESIAMYLNDPIYPEIFYTSSFAATISQHNLLKLEIQHHQILYPYACYHVNVKTCIADKTATGIKCQSHAS